MIVVRASAARARARAAQGIALASAMLTGCSPIAYARGVRDAEATVVVAERAEAERLAPYELTLARLYLEKAREASGEGHYALSLDLLARARQHAARARVLAAARSGDGTP